MCVGYDQDIRDSIADIAMVARLVLQLPSETITTTSSPGEPRKPGPSDLVIGLVVAAVVLLLMLIVVTAFVIWNRFRKIKR